MLDSTDVNVTTFMCIFKVNLALMLANFCAVGVTTLTLTAPSILQKSADLLSHHQKSLDQDHQHS